jgi:hypothetical protein
MTTMSKDFIQTYSSKLGIDLNLVKYSDILINKFNLENKQHYTTGEIAQFLNCEIHVVTKFTSRKDTRYLLTRNVLKECGTKQIDRFWNLTLDSVAVICILIGTKERNEKAEKIVLGLRNAYLENCIGTNEKKEDIGLVKKNKVQFEETTKEKIGKEIDARNREQLINYIYGLQIKLKNMQENFREVRYYTLNEIEQSGLNVTNKEFLDKCIFSGHFIFDGKLKRKKGSLFNDTKLTFRLDEEGNLQFTKLGIEWILTN